MGDRGRALITGASSGVGREFALRHLQAGGSAALLARGAEELERLAAPFGSRALCLPTDVTDHRQVVRSVETAAQAFGGLDLVVNAAGVAMPTPLMSVTESEWDRNIDVNLAGTFHVARECGLRMRGAGGGAIVNVGSELSLGGESLYVPYCASKFAVAGLTHALSVELGPEVRVHLVCPGPIDTPMMDAELEWFPDSSAARAEAEAAVPLKRFATPGEVAEAIAMLACEPGLPPQVLRIDGGTTL